MAAHVSNDPEESQVAELLKQRIKDCGYTHESFAEVAGVSPSRVSQWVTNRGGVPAERAFVVARHLGLTPEAVSMSWRTLRDQFWISQVGKLDRGTGPTVRGAGKGSKAQGIRVAEEATAYPTPDLLGAYLCASARTRAAVDLLLLPEAERAAAIAGDSALVAGVALIEQHAADAMRKRNTD